MPKFLNKYRITSARMHNWDYGSNSAYFVTICTANRVCFFGKIANGKMYLSDVGEIADKYFAEIPEHFPHVYLNAYIIMPNHVHGIIIDKPYYGKPDIPNRLHVSDETIVKTPNLGVSILTNNWKPGALGL